MKYTKTEANENNEDLPEVKEESESNLVPKTKS